MCICPITQFGGLKKLAVSLRKRPTTEKMTFCNFAGVNTKPMKYSFKELRIKSQESRKRRPQRKQKTMPTSTDKLLDYMFDLNDYLTNQIAAVSEELRLQREQADRHHRDLKSSLARMEERAIAAERRADAEAKIATMESEARVKAEKRLAELMKILESMTHSGGGVH